MPSNNNSGNESPDAPAAALPGIRQRKGGLLLNLKTATKEAKNALMQQRLKSWQPVMTPKYAHMYHSIPVNMHHRWVIGSFGLIGIVFVTLGAVLLGYSDSVVEVEKRYETEVEIDRSDFIAIPITKAMSAPIFVYYELTNFYQNHRKYVKSRDDDQLVLGTKISTTADAYSTNCDPWYQSSYVANDVTTHKQLYPCGLVARSVFNDTFTFSYTRGESDNRTIIDVNESPDVISWSQDRLKKFDQALPTFVPPGKSAPLIELVDMWILKWFPPQVCMPRVPTASPRIHRVATRPLADGSEVADCDFTANPPTCNFTPACTGDYAAIPNPSGYGVNNGHFINWMRTAGLSTFRKLYGRIDVPLEEGDVLYVGVQSNFPVLPYRGTKAVVLSTTTWAGGKNNFLGISYIVVGGLALIFTLVYAVMHLKRPRRLIDIDYLDWGESH